MPELMPCIDCRVPRFSLASRPAASSGGTSAKTAMARVFWRGGGRGWSRGYGRRGFLLTPRGSGLAEPVIVGVRVAASRRFCHPRRIDVRGGGSALQTDTEETTVIM